MELLLEVIARVWPEWQRVELLATVSLPCSRASRASRSRSGRMEGESGADLQPARTRARTSSGWCLATWMATYPPMATPPTTTGLGGEHDGR